MTSNYSTLHRSPFFSFFTINARKLVGMSAEEGIEAARACVKELQTRMVLNSPKYLAKIVDSNGTRVIEL